MLAAFTDDPFPWLAVLGRCHPLVLHLPLGLIPALAVLEYGSMVFRRPVPRGAIITIAWLSAVTAGIATASGLALSGEGGYVGDTVFNHKVAGIAVGVLSLASAIAACFAKRTAFRILLLLTFATMIPAGHLGGSLSHGKDWLFEPFDQHEVQNGGAAKEAGTEPVSQYVSVIAPWIKRTCGKCHNEDKQKAELLLTTPEGILKGSEYGEVLVPGDPDKSLMLTNCLLPLDDEEHMPPEDKPQPTVDELEQLRAWIAGGAKFK